MLEFSGASILLRASRLVPFKRWGFALLCACSLQAVAAVQVVDDRGVTVNIERAPKRVLSLLPSLTEVVCALDACARLVGVDDFSNWPAQVRSLPHLGGLEDTNIEAVLALRPDVVLVSGSSRAVSRLEMLGLKVVALEPRTLADVQRVTNQVALVLGTGDPQRLWRNIQESVDAAALELPPELRGTRVYFEVSAGPYAASESSFIGELLNRLGLANIVPAHLGPFPRLNPEFVMRADPQLIMVSERDARELKSRPGWERIRALREGRVCVFTHEQADVLLRPGPRMADAARLMVQCLRGRLKGGAP